MTTSKAAQQPSRPSDSPTHSRGSSTARSAGPGQRQTHRLLHRLHFFAGVLCAPLIMVAAVTGLLYAVSPTVEQVANRDMLHVTVPDSGPLPVSQLVDTARQRHPDLTLSGVRLGAADETTRVLFTDPSLPESTVRAVFVDPYTAEIRGDSTQYGSSASLPFRQWVSEGHRTLWLGNVGRLYSETAASWLGVLAVGGFVLLWTRQRRGAGTREKVRGLLRTGGSGRVRISRRHSTTGTLIVLGLLFLTVTGLTWSSFAGENISRWRSAMDWETPTVSTALPGTSSPSSGDAAAATSAAPAAAGHESHGGHATAGGGAGTGVRVSGLGGGSVDRVADTARHELRTPVTITPPTAEGQAWTATENRAPYRLSNNSVSVDWATGRVIERLDFSSWPFAAKATAWLIQLHMGTLFGLPNQLVLALLAAAIIAMVVRGYAMWWMRRPTGGLAGAPRRAGWSRPGVGTVVTGAVLVAYGFLAPLFGVTCLAFLAVSLLWSGGSRLMTRLVPRQVPHPVPRSRRHPVP